MGLDSGLTWSVINDFCFRYCVEFSGGNHDISDAFTKVYYLNLDGPEEGVARPFHNYCDCFQVYSCEGEFHGKTGPE